MTKANLLFLEVTSHCNMHCTFCPSDDMQRPKSHVSEEDAIRFIRSGRDLAPDVAVMFNVVGEPLLNKKVFDYIGLCEENNLRVALITNITLLNEERLRKLYEHKNVTLVMSLHTPTEKSFAERGYKKIKSFNEYLQLVCNAIEAKFQYRSETWIDVYLASELIENLMQNDAGSRLWTLFDDPKEYAAGWDLCVERFTEVAERVKQKYPEAYQEGLARARHDYKDQIEAGTVVFSPSEIPSWRLENEVSGWMCLPGVMVRRKGFGMWAYHEKFVRRHAQPGRFVFHEERTEPFKCVGALTFGILSDGTYSLCCQDVEGEMDIGNIKTLDPTTAFHSARRAEIIENCATSRICRRCAGNTMILDTGALRCDSQVIDKFGFGWHGFEPGLFGRGGRWTSGSGKAYFFTRLDASELYLEIRSPFPSKVRFQALLSSYDPATKKFSLEQAEEFHGVQDQMNSVTLPIKTQRDTFYRLTLLSPTFAPKERYRVPDTRRLGIAVASLKLLGQPYEDVVLDQPSLALPGAAATAPGQQDYSFTILN